MSAGFTPGPWWLNRDEDDHENEWELLGRGEETVCALQHFGRKSTAEANARLIASAPELYEALRACEAYFETLEEAGDEKHPVMLKLIRGPLAKASGDIPSGRSG